MIRHLVLALVASACSHPHAPATPAAPPRNEAVHYATTKVTADAACQPLSTAQSGRADTAFCDLGRVLAYCISGLGMDGTCIALADMRPKQQAQQQAQPTTEPAPSSPAPAPAPAADAKPRAEPPPAKGSKK